MRKLYELIKESWNLFEEKRFTPSLKITLFYRTDKFIIPAFRLKKPYGMFLLQLEFAEEEYINFGLYVEYMEELPPLTMGIDIPSHPIEIGYYDVIEEIPKEMAKYPINTKDYYIPVSSIDFILSPEYYFLMYQTYLEELEEMRKVREDIVRSNNPLKSAYEVWIKYRTAMEMLEGAELERMEVVEEAVRDILTSLLILRYNEDFVKWLLEVLDEVYELLTPSQRFIKILENTLNSIRLMRLIS